MTYNHLAKIDDLSNEELIEKIYDLSDKIVKAQKSGYANSDVLASMMNLQEQLREEYSVRVAQEKIKHEPEDEEKKSIEIGKIYPHE